MSKVYNVAEEFPLAVPSMNGRINRTRLKAGELSLATGVDGRFGGALRKFPGFRLLKDFGLTSVAWFKYVALQKGTSSYTLRGFLFLESVASVYKIRFHYYDDDPAVAGWKTAVDVVTSGLSATSVCTADGNGRFAYVAVDGLTPKVLYCASAGGGAATVTVASLGIGSSYTAPTVPVPSGSGTGGLLSDGEYLVGYRYYDNNRNRWSGMASATITLSGGTATQKITFSKPGSLAPYTDGYTHVYLYRSLSADVAGDVYNAGILWNESSTALASDAWSATIGSLADLALVLQDPYDPWQDAVGLPPNSGQVAVVGNCTFLSSDTSQPAITQLQFSNLRTYMPETFPTSNTYRWAAEDGPVRSFVHCGDILYAWCDNAAVRIVKSGPQVSLARVQGGRGIVGKDAACAVGKDMIVLTPNGLMLVDGLNGNMQSVGAIDSYLVDRRLWQPFLNGVVIRNDASFGCSFVFNPDQSDAFVIWHNSGAVTRLEDLNFAHLTEGPNPTSGGASRCWWVTSTGRVLSADEGGWSGPSATDPDYSNWGLDSTITQNGTITSATASSMTYSSSTGWTTAALSGAKVYVWRAAAPTAAPVVATIATVSGTGSHVLNIGLWSETPAAGDRFTIAPVPFKVRAWPLRSSDNVIGDFCRKTVETFGVHALNVINGGTANDYWGVGVCRNLTDTPDAGSRAYIPFSDPEDYTKFAAMHLDGIAIEPYIEQFAAGVGFELISLSITGKITPNRQSG